MKAMMIRAFTALALLALAACGQPAPDQSQAPADGNNNRVLLGSTQNMPDWLFIARQRDCLGNEDEGERCPTGEIHFNQRTITRTPEGFADIWIQVRHGRQQLFEYETETTATAIQFELERLHYRFNCNTTEFIVIERQIMGPREAVVARDEPRQIYRAPIRGSVTNIILPIACRGR